MAIPVLKWAGGKRQLLDELYKRFPEEYTQYHEPFFGGGALFFDLEPMEASINDTNTRLINFYIQVRDYPEDLIERLREFDDPESDPNPERDFSETNRKGREIKNYFYQQRELFNNRPYGDEYDLLEEAALLLYLNRTCYNGLYRENSDGGFNAPIGRYSNPDWVRADEIRNASDVLSGTDIHNTDWSYVIDEAEPGDLVYFDPPYEPMSPTANFTDYSADGFDKDDQQELCDAAVKLSENGVNVILSNSGIMYEMYDDAGFTVDIEGATRAINSDGENRDEVDEIIATNIPMESRQTIGQQTLTDITNQ
jgi:DNA adenine methylase